MVESKIDLRGELRIDDVVSMFGQWELHLGDGLLDEYRWKADGAWELVADFANGLMYSISAEHVVFRRTTNQHRLAKNLRFGNSLYDLCGFETSCDFETILIRLTHARLRWVNRIELEGRTIGCGITKR